MSIPSAEPEMVDLPIAAPEDFPVSWADPADARLTWMREPVPPDLAYNHFQ